MRWPPQPKKHYADSWGEVGVSEDTVVDTVHQAGAYGRVSLSSLHLNGNSLLLPYSRPAFCRSSLWRWSLWKTWLFILPSACESRTEPVSGVLRSIPKPHVTVCSDVRCLTRVHLVSTLVRCFPSFLPPPNHTVPPMFECMQLMQ